MDSTEGTSPRAADVPKVAAEVERAGRFDPVFHLAPPGITDPGLFEGDLLSVGRRSQLQVERVPASSTWQSPG